MKNRLQELRQLHQRSQADLARELGVSRQAINGFESGKFDPSLEMAFKIANLFRVKVEDVFIYEGKNSMPTIVARVKNFFGLEFGFERFTEKTIEAIDFARNEAARSQHPQVEPIHLLLGLLSDPTMTSARLLRANGATIEIEIRDRAFESRGKIKFSSKSKFVLELALQIVRLQGKKSIGTEHLLWGLARLAETDKTTLNELFQDYGIDVKALNDEFDRLTDLAEII
ncbi:MAG: helix-turn-helix domain-containing protein [Cyanosarcina radialis HA8281-LM2]|jgi:putative transcriptional regulator|nr:helix-turn-helix domain-containing protein [Cyanosarcina radialis HA8281-LM2]